MRCATCVSSDTEVVRDPFYDGHTVLEKCAVVSRLSPNFFRFGSMEICNSLPIDENGEVRGSVGT